MNHGHKDTKTKCRLYWRLMVFIDGDTVSHAGIFDPALLTFAPLTFSLLFTSPTSPFPKLKYSVWLGGDRGCLVVLETDQEFNTLYLTRFRTYKIALPTPTKTQEHCIKSELYLAKWKWILRSGPKLKMLVKFHRYNGSFPNPLNWWRIRYGCAALDQCYWNKENWYA